LWEFLLRRLIRIYPVFAFFTLAFFTLNRIAHVYPDKYSVASLLLNLGFINIYSATPALSPNAWSLTFEANFHVFAGVSCLLLTGRRSVALALIAVAAIAFLITFPIAAYCVVGCGLYALRGLQPKSLPRTLQLAVFAAWCVLAGIIDHESRSMLNVALLAGSAIFVFVVTVPTGLFARLAAMKWVFFLGTISYSFYLTHPYTYIALRVFLQDISLDTWSIAAAAAVYFPAMTTAALIGSYIVYRLLEVAPYRVAFGESVFKRSPPSDRRGAEAAPATATT
jgi:peptidoglycan/LPS O-acetylase OafA/YrhL